MTLIDTSAWVEFLRATGSATHQRLKAILESGGEILTTEPVALELLAGVNSPADRIRVKRTLAACRLVSIQNAADWEDAASIYLACRRSGATPGELLDCLIAAVAIRAGVPVLTQGRDFELIAEHTPLELVP